MTPNTYKFRQTARVTSVMVILFLSAGFLGTIWAFFIFGREPSSYAWGALCLIGYGFFLRQFVRQSLHCVSFRLQVGEHWIAVRDFGTLTVIPFNKVVGFAEQPLIADNKFSGYHFAFLGADGSQVSFSTQIVGWAEIIQSVHRALPHHVPDVRSLEARRVMKSLELPSDAAAFTAPGKDSLKAWRATHIARWYDYWVGYALGFLVFWWPAQWMTERLKQVGWRHPWIGLLVVPLLILSSQISATICARILRRQRKSKRRTINYDEPGRN
jgi:hypothetical protein